MLKRFKDKNYILHDFLYEFHLVCPDCGKKAISKNNVKTFESLISCTNCSFRISLNNKAVFLSLTANCNNCGEKIDFLQKVPEKKDQINIRCMSCNTAHKFKPKVLEFITFQITVDQYGLWYSESFKGNYFWAFNTNHLNYIEEYVKADFRERHNRKAITMVERLPKFVKSAKNRDDLLKLIEKMKHK